jgi:hypothetical protein
MVPKDLLARFSGHTRVLTHQDLPFGDPASPISATDLAAVFTDLIAIADLVALEHPKDLRRGIDFLVLQSGRYLPAQVVGRFRLYRARPDAPRPPDPDARLQAILRWDQMGETKRRWADLSLPQ